MERGGPMKAHLALPRQPVRALTLQAPAIRDLSDELRALRIVRRILPAPREGSSADPRGPRGEARRRAGKTGYGPSDPLVARRYLRGPRIPYSARRRSSVRRGRPSARAAFD